MTALASLAVTRAALRELARVVKTIRQLLTTFVQQENWPNRQQTFRWLGQLAQTLVHLAA